MRAVAEVKGDYYFLNGKSERPEENRNDFGYYFLQMQSNQATATNRQWGGNSVERRA